jgi:hypothetical protein
LLTSWAVQPATSMLCAVQGAAVRAVPAHPARAGSHSCCAVLALQPPSLESRHSTPAVWPTSARRAHGARCRLLTSKNSLRVPASWCTFFQMHPPASRWAPIGGPSEGIPHAVGDGSLFKNGSPIKPACIPTPALAPSALVHVQGGPELRKPDDRVLARFDLRPASINAAAADAETARACDDCVTSWCRQVS